MANIAKVLREEISRLARKELRVSVARLAKDNARLKRDAADLKRRVAELERDSRILKKRAADIKVAVPDDELGRMRVTGSLVAKLRERLGLTQDELGSLLGVSGQMVYQYERREGKLRLRNETKLALVRVRRMGKREARRELDG